MVFDGNISSRELIGFLPKDQFHLPDFVKITGAARGNVQAATAKSELDLANFGKIKLDGTLRDDSIFEINLVAQNLLVSQIVLDSNLISLKSVGFSAKISGAGFDFGKTARRRLINSSNSEGCIKR